MAGIGCVLFMVSECKTQGESKFKEAFTAVLSLSEAGSWVTFCLFSAYRTKFGNVSIAAVIAILCYIGVNVSHAVVHTRKIIPMAPKSY